MSFTHSIAGGQGNLIATSFQSPNFIHDVSGWQIAKDGSAEFNDVIIRGGTVIGGTQLTYNGTPALGNLVSSISELGGTDTHGNRYLSGVVSYASVGGGYQASQLQGGSVAFQISTSYGGAYTYYGTIDNGIFNSENSLQFNLLGSVAYVFLGPMAIGTVYVYPPSNDSTGVTDTAAINYALSAGYSVQLTLGTYFISAPLALASSGNVVFLNGATIELGSSWSGAEFFSVSASYCSLVGPGLLAGPGVNNSSQIDGFAATASQGFKVIDVHFTGMPGWCVRSTSTVTANAADSMIRGIVGRSCAGGVYLQGYEPSNSTGENFLTDVQLQQMGAASGGATGLDAILLEDCHDILAEQINVGFNGSAVGSGAAIHCTGSMGSSQLKSLDVGAGPGGVALLINDGPNGSVFELTIDGYEGGQVQIAGAGHRIRMLNSIISGSPVSGAVVSSTGFDIDFIDCSFFGNGTGASGTNYDLDWTGTAHGRIVGCEFNTPIVATGSSGVQGSITFASGSRPVQVLDPYFTASGTASGNQVINLPTIFRMPIAQGTATLIAGVVVIGQPLVSSTTQIELRCISASGVPGALFVSSTTAGTGFDINSTSATDTSKVAWTLYSGG